MSVLKILADGFHEGGWGMWPILFLFMLTLSILILEAAAAKFGTGDEPKVTEH